MHSNSRKDIYLLFSNVPDDTDDVLSNVPDNTDDDLSVVPDKTDEVVLEVTFPVILPSGYGFRIRPS